MTVARTIGRPKPVISHQAALAAVLSSAAVVLALLSLARTLPPHLWLPGLVSPDLSDPRQLVAACVLLPRVATAWACGAGLALAGLLIQQVTRNPLADGSTLGTAAGAQLALAAATVLMPNLAGYGRDVAALLGAGCSTLLVFALAFRRGLDPLTLILAGLIVGLISASLASILVLISDPYDVSVYLWGAGSLEQNDWSAVRAIAPCFCVCLAAAGLMARAIGLLGLGDGARSLGIPVLWVRAATVGIAVWMTATVVAAIGTIGFVGLAAPALVRMAGVQRFGRQLLWCPPIGAALLALTDQVVLLVSGANGDLIPTGAAVAVVGAPFLLWLLGRTRLPLDVGGALPSHDTTRSEGGSRRLLVLALALALLVLFSLGSARTQHGFAFGSLADVSAWFPWRAPPLFGVLSAGAMLAVAGVLLQRLTGNAMASPEVLGIGAGAALGMIAVSLWQVASSVPLAAGACAGAGLALALLILVSRRSAFAPDNLLLAGVVLSVFLAGTSDAVLAAGGPGMSFLKTWLAGSADLVTTRRAVASCIVAAFLIAAVPTLRRPLEILPLGSEMARALGVDPARMRLCILLLTAGFTAAATLIVGPLGFVGLMAPHLAMSAGLRRAVPQIVGAALFGGMIMVSADWLGRNLLFPYQVPAGLLAALIGGPYFLVLLARRERA